MRMPYQYFTLRCVPRVDREEFFNLGLVLYCQDANYLQTIWQINNAKARALDPEIDIDAVIDTLMFMDGVCDGDEESGSVASEPLGTRFGFLKAPRSTVVQTGPVHGGTTEDPSAEMHRLVQLLVE